MYRHLMVPVDGSVLSAANVSAGVQLAARLGARITFFHATADLAATGDGMLLKTIAPEEFAKAELGDSHAVLSRCAASAAADGVAAETVARICDRPAEAIVEAALACGCDLIVTASRGARGVAGWLHSLQTEAVLRRSPLALLVTRVASNDPLNPCERALAIIQDEHRSIAVVVRGMRNLVQHAEESAGSLDCRALRSCWLTCRRFRCSFIIPRRNATCIAGCVCTHRIASSCWAPLKRSMCGACAGGRSHRVLEGSGLR
jgi:nucleotide-binding universal stress UspA family protein